MSSLLSTLRCVLSVQFYTLFAEIVGLLLLLLLLLIGIRLFGLDISTGSCSGRCTSTHIGQQTGYLLEELLNALAALGAYLFEYHVIIFGQPLRLLPLNNPLLLQIVLIAQYRHNTPLPTLMLNIINPLLHAIKRRLARNIIHNHSYRRITNVIRYKSTKALLPSRIP